MVQELKLSFTIDKSTFLVSDFHLGDGSRADDFRETQGEEDFIRFLDRVAQKGKRLIIIGDFFELWQFHLTSCLKSYYRLLDKLHQVASQGVELVYVFGNHDSDLGYFQALFDFLVESFDIGDTVHVEHGHRFDKDTGFTWKIRKAAVWLVSWPERWIDRNCDEKLDRFLQKYRIFQPKTPASKRYRGTLVEYEDEVQKLLEKYQLVILGHTHCPLLKQLTETGIYANSGTWVKGRRDYLFIEDNHITLDEFRS